MYIYSSSFSSLPIPVRAFAVAFLCVSFRSLVLFVVGVAVFAFLRLVRWTLLLVGSWDPVTHARLLCGMIITVVLHCIMCYAHA